MFYTLTDYEIWLRTLSDTEQRKWTIKYYKGLGTSDSKEAKEYFRDMRIIKYVHSLADA